MLHFKHYSPKEKKEHRAREKGQNAIAATGAQTSSGRSAIANSVKGQTQAKAAHPPKTLAPALLGSRRAREGKERYRVYRAKRWVFDSLEAFLLTIFGLSIRSGRQTVKYPVQILPVSIVSTVPSERDRDRDSALLLPPFERDYTLPVASPAAGRKHVVTRHVSNVQGSREKKEAAEYGKSSGRSHLTHIRGSRVPV